MQQIQLIELQPCSLGKKYSSKNYKGFAADIVCHKVIEPKKAFFSKKKLKFNNRFDQVLKYLEIDRLYSHQCKAIELIQKGFKGCVFKSDTYDEINIAIDKVMSGELFFPDAIQL